MAISTFLASLFFANFDGENDEPLQTLRAATCVAAQGRGGQKCKLFSKRFLEHGRLG